MKCRGVFSKDADKEIELDLPDNATISDVRDAIAKMNGCNRKRVDLSLNNVVLEDSQPARCLIESGDVPFRYDYSIPRRIFMFDYNNRHVRLDLDVDSSFKEIASMLEKKIASLRSIDFSLYYNGQPLDLTTKTLDDYNIPPSGLILVVESMMELTVGLPTGNDKVYTILKSKRVVDLKERISASLFIAAQNLVVTNNGTTLADDVPLESLSSSEASSLLCAIQVPVTIIPDTKCAVFWDISSNLNATAQFLVDSLVAALHNLQALKTTLLFNGVAMRDEDLLSSYGVDNATFIYMVTEEEAQCIEPQSLKDSFDRLLAQPPSSRTRRELESNAKWVCDCLAKGTLQPTAFAGQLEGVFAYIGASREAGLITVLQRLVLLLCESAAQPLTLSLQVVPVCMRALTLLVGKGAWSGVAGCVSILHRAILPNVEAAMRCAWTADLFYQLYTVLYIVGCSSEEVFTTLRQILDILVAMQARDQTLEFKKALSPEKLFLNRYPDLKADYLPIARSILSHVSDFLSIRYIFNHYFDEPSVVRLLLEHNIILSFANNRRIPTPSLFTGSLRQQYGKELAEPITRCLNAFSNNEGITRYFITLLGILANEQRTSFATASPIAAQITAVLQHADLLAVFVAAARQWSDGYTRLLFLFLCTLFATDPSSHSLLVQNSAVFLPSLADATLFSPKNSSYWSDPASHAVLTVFDTIWSVSTAPKCSRDLALSTLSTLSRQATAEFLRTATHLIDGAIDALLAQLRQQTLAGNRQDFCRVVAEYYKSLLAGVMEHDECISFEGEIPPCNYLFLTFFVRNSDIPEFAEVAPNFGEWLAFFLQVVESIYKDDDDAVDLEQRRPYLFKTEVVPSLVKCLVMCMRTKDDANITKISAMLVEIIDLYKDEMEEIGNWLMAELLPVLDAAEVQPYMNVVMDFISRGLVNEALFWDFLEADGLDKLMAYIESLKEKGQRYEVTVIRFMDAFSYINSIASLLKAINLGYSTIADSIYFENQISNIAKQIVDLEEVVIEKDDDDAMLAAECLTAVRASSSILSAEEKAILKKAASRITYHSCSCVVV
ncbi:hypothetical protein AV274_1051 [Blastocystis sp. ATCC 50177/Nand II]|uniref:Ubiquitin-like domain-containing protein n=1 Tax=Blastocystis sp. subtype 1 (strain ATCC 50177 / NandII) TaxID=478820 RepID=A0A196SLY0_BLAHN|nr:hypothetical protein AV274_1051 [Blastocystis sp. ATCC 50177/Nand II]